VLLSRIIVISRDRHRDSLVLFSHLSMQFLCKTRGHSKQQDGHRDIHCLFCDLSMQYLCKNFLATLQIVCIC
jgi:hypothetical protein